MEPDSTTQYAFPPRPKLVDNPYTKSYQVRGLHANAARLRFSLDKGSPQFADMIYQIDRENIDWTKASPFQNREIALFHVTNILLSMSNECLEAIIEFRLHEYVPANAETGPRLPKHHRLMLPGPEAEQERLLSTV